MVARSGCSGSGSWHWLGLHRAWGISSRPCAACLAGPLAFLLSYFSRPLTPSGPVPPLPPAPCRQKAEEARLETERILAQQEEEVRQKRLEMERRDKERLERMRVEQEERAIANAAKRAKAQERIQSGRPQQIIPPAGPLLTTIGWLAVRGSIRSSWCCWAAQGGSWLGLGRPSSPAPCARCLPRLPRELITRCLPAPSFLSYYLRRPGPEPRDHAQEALRL